ncbi:DUF1059 domain-containing protein [Actinomycetospora chiangmaiensis]|uniref:DUF1059 domain-containing protein n=1 Tax=Actinomycetospora chiangmaiensis TaxID=402650 RepID=UPI00037FB3B2|nr:DUF1059 domain-containing protein [Actinomycetospora chiangmaiensis]
MTRMMIDCREVPSDSGCTLTLTGEPDEVIRAAAAHAVDVHGHADDEELRAGLRAALRDVPDDGLVAEGAFVQLIEFRTRRIQDFEATEDGWAEAIGRDRTARWAITGADRDHPGAYVQVVAFPDYAGAMANSDHPATAEFAERLGKLCDGEPTFHNLDVHRATVWS